MPYEKLGFGDRWLLLSGAERSLIDKLYKRCKRLDDGENTSQIYQGLITSADAIYHLKKLGNNRYLCTPKGAEADPAYEVQIEDQIMKPLVSGAEAKRYIAPKTDTYLLFPYDVSGGQVSLIDERSFNRQYPKAWNYLKSYKSDLKSREGGKFDDDDWYRFGRHQNLDKQEVRKLIVAQTVPSLRVSFDDSGECYLNNVRVNGIIPSDGLDPWFLTGVLNAPVCDFVFRRIAKPKDGGWFEANRQFIAPLPIPPASAKQRDDVARRARGLQARHTARRDILNRLTKRLKAVQSKSHPETFLFPDLATARSRLGEAPRNLEETERREWAKQQYEQDLQGRYDAISSRLAPGVELNAEFTDGELTFSVDGIKVLSSIFLKADEGAFIAAQWKVLASTYSVTERTDGKKLCNALRKMIVTENKALVDQIIELEVQLSDLEGQIKAEEAEINALTYTLYGLTAEEIQMVEQG